MTQPLLSRKISFHYSLTALRRQAVRVLLYTAATLPARMLLLIVFVGVLGWLMYSMTWQPLIAPVPLPFGVSAQDPRLDTDSLRAVERQRIERTGRPVLFSGQAISVFVAPLPSPSVRP